MVSHLVFEPHDPGQGSPHFLLIQAKFGAHSVLIVHSGLQDGGLPMKSGKHEHTDCPLIDLHWLLGPQGDGLQGRLIV